MILIKQDVFGPVLFYQYKDCLCQQYPIQVLWGIPACAFFPQVEEKEGRGGTGETELFFLISANFRWTRSKNVLHACMHMWVVRFQLS